MISGENYYAWNPIRFRSKDEETNRYFGNVIGNMSLEDMLKIVNGEGSRQKTDIKIAANELANEIKVRSSKFVSLWQIVDQVYKDVTGLNPEPRSSADASLVEQLMDEYMESLGAPEESGNESSGSEEIPEAVPLDENFYLWSPNFVKSKNPDTERYFGNVIGNLSKVEQIQEVLDEGARQKADITTIGAERAQEIAELASKYKNIKRLNKDVMKEIVAFFGGVFVLDSSALDSAPLG